MTKVRRAVGAFGERVAAEHLLAAGMVVLDRNWRCRDGELDIVARDGPDTLVICEVKTRRSTTFGAPAEAVHPAKVRRLRRLAAAWVAARQVHLREIRFDVVSVRQRRNGPPQVEHLRGAF